MDDGETRNEHLVREFFAMREYLDTAYIMSVVG
jgi:hypothetical protein